MKKKQEKKLSLIDWIGFFGISTVTASTITLIEVFYKAYFTLGVTRVLIDFNAYGEAIPEMIILPTGLVAFWIWLIKRKC